jgi:hypothetical protein
MPAASAFATTYLDPAAGTLVNKNPRPFLRFQVANAVYDLVRFLNEGANAPSTRRPRRSTRKQRHMKALYRARVLRARGGHDHHRLPGDHDGVNWRC